MCNSEDTRVLHFGLHDLRAGARLEVRWPDGTTASFTLGRDFGDDTTVKITYPGTLDIVPH